MDSKKEQISKKHFLSQDNAPTYKAKYGSGSGFDKIALLECVTSPASFTKPCSFRLPHVCIDWTQSEKAVLENTLRSRKMDRLMVFIKTATYFHLGRYV